MFFNKNGNCTLIKLCIDTALSLKLSNGNAELAANLLEMLLQDLEKNHHAINSAFSDARFHDALELVHKLHGATCYCGTPHLKTACHQLETHLRDVNDMPCQEDRRQFDTAVASLLHWQKNYDVRTLFALD